MVLTYLMDIPALQSDPTSEADRTVVRDPLPTRSSAPANAS